MRHSMSAVFAAAVLAALASAQPHGLRAFERRADQPADAFTVNQRLGRGVNIIGYDPIWQDRARARFKESDFARIRDAGFTSVRINLQPFRHMDAADGYRLDPAWLDTLDWAVTHALAADLMVILDMHEFGAMGRNPEGHKDEWLAFWRQVAPRYTDSPDAVVFELLNEPFGKLTDEMWNQYLREGLAVVRQTNPTRTVIVGPGHWNGIGALANLDLPQDDRNLIVTVHYYAPMAFTHQGAPWAEEFKDTTGVGWLGTDQERQKIETDFARANQWAEAHDRPILLGEFGAYDKADMDSRARYTAAVARTAERFGWSWAYWQFDSDFVVFDVEKDQWVEPLKRALVP
jgi:endoglucanase